MLKVAARNEKEFVPEIKKIVAHYPIKFTFYHVDLRKWKMYMDIFNTWRTETAKEVLFEIKKAIPESDDNFREKQDYIKKILFP